MRRLSVLIGDWAMWTRQFEPELIVAATGIDRPREHVMCQQALTGEKLTDCGRLVTVRMTLRLCYNWSYVRKQKRFQGFLALSAAIPGDWQGHHPVEIAGTEAKRQH
jgi:hypothetical protein